MASKFQTWVDNRWRPVAAWTYLLICIFDFIISPIVFSWFQFTVNQPISQWIPLTLQGSGIVHISFGAIIGITAWGRTIEKMKVHMGNKDRDNQDDSYRGHRYGSYEQPYDNS